MGDAVWETANRPDYRMCANHKDVGDASRFGGTFKLYRGATMLAELGQEAVVDAELPRDASLVLETQAIEGSDRRPVALRCVLQQTEHMQLGATYTFSVLTDWASV